MFGYMSRYATDAARSGNWDDRYFYGRPMMWGFGGGQSGLVVGSVFSVITWILVIMVLVALFRWLWKKGNKS